MKNNKKILTGLVIGSSGIGKVHIREFLNYGMMKVGILGRIFRSDRIKKLKFRKSKSKKIFNLKNLVEVKKFKPEVISICSPTSLHLNHIQKFGKITKRLLVEKPILWKKNANNNLIVKRILRKNKKLIVNLPMINLAEQIKKKEKIKKIRNIQFIYNTKGKNTYTDIPIDLLPHAISFSIQFLKTNKIKYKIIRVVNKKNSWNCEIYLNGCNCNYFFSQNKKRKLSNLSFKLNNAQYIRKQVKAGNNYVNKIIKNKKKVINIKNPMTEYILKIINNFDNINFLKLNRKFVTLTTRITNDLIVYKENENR